MGSRNKLLKHSYLTLASKIDKFVETTTIIFQILRKKQFIYRGKAWNAPSAF